MGIARLELDVLALLEAAKDAELKDDALDALKRLAQEHRAVITRILRSKLTRACRSKVPAA